MRIIAFLVSLIVTVALAYALSISIKIKPGVTLPPLAKFFCPFTGFWQNAVAKNELTNTKLHLSGIEKGVEIKMDDRMVPHINAQNDHDLLYTQGYITAANRLWQMDIATRAASGRLSEVLGNRTSKVDRMNRRKGLMLAAENSLQSWKTNKKSFELVEAYVAGVNAYINQLSERNYPIEFKLLNYKPEQWTPIKTALFAISMAQTLASQEYDLENTNALKLFGADDYNFLYPEQNPNQTPIFPAGTKWDYIKDIPTVSNEVKNSIFGDLFKYPREVSDDPHIGSNNWTVNATKTRDSAAILCNDPHLNLTLPSIWYEIQLTAPGINTYGVSLPGIPGVIIGFNENIAWGVTNTEWDVLDWYKIKWADNNKNTYILDGKKMNVTYRIETISVRDSMTIVDSVKYTTWGPIVYEDAKSPKYGLAMRWLVHNTQSPEELESFYELDKAKNFDEYYAATNKYVKPAQNIVFASNNGDIALRILGKMPFRAKGQGKFIMDGSVTDNGWKNTLPNEDNPILKNPPTAYLTSSNQNTTAPDYPFYYGGNYDDYRGRYINRRLSHMDSISIEDMMKLQNDPYSIFAEEALPALLNQLDPMNLNTSERKIYDELKNWKYSFKAERKEPTYFKIWWDGFKEKTWDEMYSLVDSIPVMIPENWRTVQILNTDPGNKYFDNKSTTAIETAKDIVTMTFKDMVKEFDKFAKDTLHADGKWWAYRNTTIEHIGRIPAFSRKNIITDGFKDAINATTNKTGPSWRMIVELSKPVKAWGVYPGGQSGNPGSKYYDNMVDQWAKGQYNEIVFLTKDNNDSDRIVSTISISK